MEKFSKIRTEFQPWHLTLAILVLTVPQVLVQLAAVIWQEESLDIEYNSDKSVGRVVCTNNLDVGQSLFFYGFYMFIFLILLVMLMAHMTRHLPSLFNETEVIFNTAFSSMLVLALGIAIVIITDDPTTSPGISYLTWCLQVFCITLNASCRVMLPKLQMVWRGETVLVSKLVAEHARNVREDDEVYLSTSKNSGVRVTGLSTGGHQSARRNSSKRMSKNMSRRRLNKESDSQDLVKELAEFEATSYSEPQETDPNTEVIRESEDSSSPGEGADTFPTGTRDRDTEPEHQNSELMVDHVSGHSDLSRRVTFAEAPSRRRSRGMGSKQMSVIDHMVISQNETPPKRLMLKMYHLQAHLTEINQRIMSGMVVSKEEWTRLRRLTTRMGDTFHNISFDWDSSDFGSADVDLSIPLGAETTENLPDDEDDSDRLEVS